MKLFAVLAFVALAGCSVTAGVEGQFADGSEQFSGTATGYLDRSGDLTITTNSGITCTGNFVYTSGREGKGTFTCEDGRSGPFEFVSTGRRGTGTGQLGGKPFTFTFG